MAAAAAVVSPATGVVSSSALRQPYLCTASRRERGAATPALRGCWVGLARAQHIAPIANAVAVDPTLLFRNAVARRVHASASAAPSAAPTRQLTKCEEVYFEGGPHFGDLVVNVVFGLSVFWLPLTIAAVARALLVRYRLTDRRITIISGFTGQDRKDIPYQAVTEVTVVPRFIGEWGDMVLNVKGGEQIKLSAVPKFRQLKAYIDKQKVGVLSPGKGSAGFTS